MRMARQPSPSVAMATQRWCLFYPSDPPRKARADHRSMESLNPSKQMRDRMYLQVCLDVQQFFPEVTYDCKDLDSLFKERDAGRAEGI